MRRNPREKGIPSVMLLSIEDEVMERKAGEVAGKDNCSILLVKD